MISEKNSKAHYIRHSTACRQIQRKQERAENGNYKELAERRSFHDNERRNGCIVLNKQAWRHTPPTARKALDTMPEIKFA